MKSISSDEGPNNTTNQTTQIISPTQNSEEKKPPEKLEVTSDQPALSTILSALSNKPTNNTEMSSLIDKMKALFTEAEKQQPGFASNFVDSIRQKSLNDSGISLQNIKIITEEVESLQPTIDDKEVLERDAKTIDSSIGTYLMKRWREKCDHHFLKNVVLEVEKQM
jgi:hypothetical protein